MNVHVTNRLEKEEKLKQAYSQFRMRKGLSEIASDFANKKNIDSLQHRVNLCLECLLECFRAKFVEPTKPSFSATVNNSPRKIAQK